MTLKLALVFLGGGLGSLCRYGFQVLNPIHPGFPLGTFTANTLSGLILGLVIGLLAYVNSSTLITPLFVVGFCGGFSTFSTFSNEGLQMIQNGQFTAFSLYATASILFCMAALIVGYRLATYVGNAL